MGILRLARVQAGPTTGIKDSRHRLRRGGAAGLLVLLAAALLFAVPAALSSGGAPTIASDLPDYNPGQQVTLTGSNWDPAGGPVHIVVNDNVGQTWQYQGDATPDSNGNIVHKFTLPTTFIAEYRVDATQGSLSATNTFTDANPSANLDQCANDPFPSPSSDGCSASASDWINGNMGASKAVYFEGDSLPYRMTFDNLSTAGSHTITIKWDTTKGGKHALDYLTTFNRTVTTANPCLGVAGCSLASFSTFAIPADPQVTGAGVTPAAGNFTLFGGTITGVSAYSYPDGSGFAGDKSAQITITFTASVANPVLAWAGHISSRADWGLNNSAVAISGSPYHTALVDLDGSGGSQDRSLSADAVIFPGSITIIKQATPEGATSFGYTASPSPLTNFSLVDDGTSANTKLFSNITNFQTYTVNESSIPAGWGFDSLNCSVTSPNGGSFSTSTTTATINMKEGENYTCTYQNSIRQGTLIVKKHVINDNGGTKVASDFTLHVKSGASDVAGSPAAGSESGTSYTLNGGTYNVSENTPPAGYTQVSITGDCDASGDVTVVAGQTKTCTITNNDIPPQLHLRKTVINDNGGTAVDTDWTLNANGTGTNDLSGTDPVDSDNTLLADTWALSETNGPSGYSASAWVCVGGNQNGSNITVGVGQSATCTITNNDIPPKLHLRKVVVNNNGGTATVDDFTLTANGTGTNDLSGTSPVDSDGTLQADTWALSETTVAGYSAGSWNCSGGNQNGSNITVGIGGEATCTIINNDIPPQLHLRKIVINDNGGTAVKTDWTLTADGTGTNDLSGTDPVDSGVTLQADTWALSESGPSNYTASNWVCVGGNQNGANITVGIGGEATCTITNDDSPPGLHLRKVVINNNGGTALKTDWTLTADGTGSNDLSGTDPVDSGPGLQADTFALSETGPSGYTASAWVCVGGNQNGSNITITAGQSATCTITNNDIPPKLHLRKVVVNNNGGTATTADFTLTADGTNGNDLSGTSPVDSGSGLKADTWALSETGPAGYSASAWVCVGGDQNGSNITVGIGGEATCTITNNDIPPKLHLRKVVNNNNGGTATVDDFTLTADGTGTNDLSGTSPVDSDGTLQADTWALSETSVAGYTAGNWNCVGGQQNGANITVGIGGEATCTITNTDIAPKLHLRKVVTNDNGGTATTANFTLTANGTGSNDLSGTSPVDSGAGLLADTWALSETSPAGYSASAWVCVGGNQNGSNITVGIGGEATCTITNNDIPPLLHLRKVVNNNNGGTATVDDFTLTADGTNGNDLSGTSPVDSGPGLKADTWALSETNLPNYTAGSWSCVGGQQNGSNITVGIGGEATCTITNTDIAPKLHLRKVVVNNNGGTKTVADFTLTADGTGSNDLSGTSPVDSGSGLQADTWALSETTVAGYNASSWVCVGGNQNGSNITLGIGGEATCTITNDDIAPKLHLRKVVINDNGGTKTVADFTLTADGANGNDISGTSPVDSGSGLKADTFALSETNVYGYQASAWVCTGDGNQNGASITLGLNQEATCTITNDDKPPTLIVKKIVKPSGSSQSFQFQTTGTGYNGFSLAGGQQNSQQLNAGTYSVKELVPNGWILTGIGGSTDPNTPYNCTVTGSGGSSGVGSLQTQTATVTLKIGDTVTCVFENTSMLVTRTQGFWATHPQLANIAWFGGTAFGHTFTGVASVAGIGDRMICGRELDTLGKVMGAFWASVSKKTNGDKRTALDQARMQLLQQLIAAELNAAAFGSVPSNGTFAAWESALCGTNITAIKNAASQAAAFNTAGDSGTFTPGTSADSKAARAIANKAFWNIIKP